MIKTVLIAILFNFVGKEDSVRLIDSNQLLSEVEVLNKEDQFEKSILLLESVSKYDSNYLKIQTALLRCYSKNNQFDKVMELGEKFKDRTDLPANFYITLGNAYLSNNRTQEGIEIYRKGLLLFPYNTSIIYNIGYAEYSRKKYQVALPFFIETLKIDPYFTQAHQLLGNIMCKTNQRTKAVLSYLTYLAINSNQNWALVRLNDILSDGYREEGALELDLDNSAFEYYDNLLRSKAALDDRFKSLIDFEAPVAQQIELLIGKLEYVEGTGDFWMDFYVPFLEKISDKQLTSALIYFILYSSKNEKVQAWVNKNEKEKDKWIELVQSHLDGTKLTNVRSVLDSTTAYRHWYYTDGSINAIGNSYNEKNVGPFEFFHPNGRLKATGVYDDLGNKVGVWHYYHDNGLLKSSENYVGGKVEGTIDTYTEDGKLRSSGDYKNDQLDGFWRWYYPCGQVSEQYPYVQGQGSGSGQLYYEAGETKLTYSVKEGQYDGDYLLYYKSGQLANKYYYQGGVLNGVYESYYPDGILAESGEYTEDQLSGKWKTIARNGQVENQGTYRNGEKTGFWEYFYENGNKMRTENYDDAGRLQGIVNWYDIDGQLHSERSYKDDTLIGYKFFDKEGNPLSEGSDVNGNMDYVAYYASGDLQAKGTLVNGLFQGQYIVYHYNGNISFSGTMNKDQWDGLQTEFYKSGATKTRSHFENGNLTGYYQSYHNNGQIAQEGWLINGDIQQKWVEYYLDGSVNSESYYTDGKLREVEYYDKAKRIISREYYDGDILTQILQYDTLGNVFQNEGLVQSIDTLELRTASGKISLNRITKCGQDIDQIDYFTQGKLSSRYALKDSDVQKYYSYAPEGQLLAEGSYLNEQKHGSWIFYDDNGQPSFTVDYQEGEREGKSIYYYPNGQIESQCQYAQDKRNGSCHYYDPDGNLQLIKYYLPDYGVYAYQYKMDTGELSDTLIVDKKNAFELKSFFQNGRVSVIQRYNKGYYEGENIFYNAEGNVMGRTNFKNGLSHGKHSEYYANGQLRHEENYYYDENHGAETLYYQNGQLKEVINWHYGSKEGWHKRFDESGQLLSEVFYRNDREY